MEKNLLEGIVRRDRDSWRKFIELYSPQIFKTVARFLRNKEMAEEAAQEVFLRCYKYIDTFKNGYSFDSWIYRITVRVCCDILKRERGGIPLSSLSKDDKAKLLRAVNSPEKEVIDRDLVEFVLSHLNYLDRVILILSELEGLTASEIGSILGKTSFSVKMRLHRAKKRLSKILRNLEAEDGG